jgi:hypothetical protein
MSRPLSDLRDRSRISVRGETQQHISSGTSH